MAAGTRSYEKILYEVKDRVATITMNQPEKLNALGGLMREEMAHAARTADEDSEVRCMVLTGSGRAFSSGAQLEGGLPVRNEDGGVDAETLWGWWRFHNRHDAGGVLSGRELYKPLIAAVNGICYGGGMIMTTECDIVIASDKARFSMIEARMGSSGITNVPFLVGPQWAKILMLTGEIVTARRAERIGFVSLVVPHDQLLARAHAMARRIAAMPRYGVMLNKANIDGTMDMMGWLANKRFSNSHTVVTETMAMFAETPDGRRLQDIFKKEGFHAFRQARDAALEEVILPEDAE
jgi:enoyl-CoA hydratase/carnithine racemase